MMGLSEQQRLAQVKQKMKEMWGGPHRVLLLDTDPVGIQLFKKALQDAEPEATYDVAGSIEQAIGLLKTDRYSLLFLEGPFSTRRATGLLNDIKPHVPHGVRVVVLTSDPDPEAEGEWLKAGADAAIYAPVSFDRFLNEVTTFIRQNLSASR